MQKFSVQRTASPYRHITLKGDTYFGGLMARAKRRGSMELLIRDQDFSGKDFDNIDFTGTQFRNCKLDSAKFFDCRFSEGCFSHCQMNKAFICDSSFSYIRFTGCKMENAKFVRNSIRNSDFIMSMMNGAEFNSTLIMESEFHTCELELQIVKSPFERTKIENCKLGERFLERLNFLPDGEFVAYKNTRQGVVKLLIPADADRVFSTILRKCRASKAIVLELPEGCPEDSMGVPYAESMWNAEFHYEVGQTMEPWQPFDPTPLLDCTSGIHFFLTRAEAADFEIPYSKKS